MKKRNRSRIVGKTRILGKKRLGYLENLEERRLLDGNGLLADEIIGAGNLGRRDGEIVSETIINEIELEDVPRSERITNDTRDTAELIPLGFDSGEFAALTLRGELIEPTTISPRQSSEIAQANANPPIPAIEDSSFPDANMVPVTSGTPLAYEGSIGDSPGGFNSNVALVNGVPAYNGDGDYYELEDLEEGQVVTAHVDGGADTVLVLYDAFGEVIQSSEASPSVENFIQHEVHEGEAGTYYLAVVPFCEDLTGANNNCAGVGEFELPLDPNDPSTVQGGPAGDYTLTISLDDAADVDYYALDLDAGDILGVGGFGSANVLALRDADGDLLLQSSQDLSSFFPPDSPLPSGGTSSLAYVIDTPGRYYLTVNGHNYNKYQLDMRVFRPAAESLPTGEHQILFLDFDGADYNPQLVDGPADLVELSPLSDFMSDFELRDEADLIDRIVREVKEDFDALRVKNPNMEFTVLNSKDHADPFGAPNVTRVIVGGTSAELGIPGFFGLAESVDVGNFDMSETAVVLLDAFSGPENDPNSFNHYTVAPGANRADFVAQGLALTISHEAAHTFGAFHTEVFSEQLSIVDSGGRFEYEINGIGRDLVWGTADDFETNFADDIFSLSEGFTGVSNVTGMLANVFSTGQGSSGAGAETTVTGSVFSDANGNGDQDAGEGGASGVRVYIDLNGDGRFGISEPTAVTDDAGNYNIPSVLLTGESDIRVATTANQRQTSPANGGGISLADGGDLVFGVATLTGADGGTDFGDAPLTYGVASQTIQSGIRLGAAVDGESATLEDDGSDDDGVVIGTLVAGGTGTATVTATTSGFSPGVVSGWVDFNSDGQFSADERVITDASVEGTSTLTFGVPSTAVAGSSVARFRFGYQRGIAAAGTGGVGEVEDYTVSIAVSGGAGGGGTINVGPTANADSFAVMQDSASTTFNVLANDVPGTAGVATLTSVGSASQGGTVSIVGDSLSYSPAAGFAGVETFSYTIETVFGSSSANVTVNVQADSNGGGGNIGGEDDLVGFRLETANAAGEEITNIAVGSDFILNVYTDDLRTNGAGVFAAHLDVLFDQAIAAPSGPVTFGEVFTSGQVPAGGVVGTTDGEFDDYGGFAGFSDTLDDVEQLLFSVPMTAVSDGVLEFTSNFADILPRREVLLLDIEQGIPEDRISFGSTTITVGDVAAPSFTNPLNRFDVSGDGVVSARDALILVNSINRDGQRFLTTSAAGISGGPYYDVSGDGALSARDVVQVVNYLNRQAEEAAAAAEPPASDLAIAAAVDSVFAEDGDEDDDEGVL